VPVLGLQVILRASKRIPGVGLIDNIVSHKHRVGFVSDDVHDDPFWDSRPSHVPGGSTSQVVKQPPRNASFATGGLPGFANISDGEFVSMEDPRYLPLAFH